MKNEENDVTFLEGWICRVLSLIFARLLIIIKCCLNFCKVRVLKGSSSPFSYPPPQKKELN